MRKTWPCLLATPLIYFSLIASEPSSEPSLSYRVIPNQASLPILTPSLAERRVEKLELANGLQVLLISDPGVDQSAAGVAVRVGSWQDPKEYPGTAHFLEHMLFMGTKAYPSEFEYMQFIHEHGGKVNAFTSSDRTVYMFSINNEAFDEALDRFSHFFIDPLLSTNCIDRELHAVDQEHAKNIEHDGWRQWMILKESGNPAHPNCSFSTGNAQTLSGIPQQVLRAWYQTHYSADKMHLVMISPLPLSQMRELALNDFSAVPQVTSMSAALEQPVTSDRQRGHMVFIKPVKDLKELSLTWEVPRAFATDIDRKAPALVSYALGQEGPHSLAQILKQEKLAEDLSVQCDRLSPDTLLFSINITLTEGGLKKVDTIISRVFETLARLKKEGFPAHFFNEIQSLATLNHQFQSRDDAFASVMAIAAELPYEPLASYPERSRIPAQYDPAFIHQFLSTLTAESCIYFVTADPTKTQIPTTTKEQWMQAEYTIKPVSRSRMNVWNQIAPNEQILLPQANPYLPKQLDLVSAPQSQPLLIVSDPGATVYYAGDDRYQVPQISHSFTFHSPLLQNTATSQILCDLYMRAFLEKLSAPLALANHAGLQVSLYQEDLCLKLTVNGYHDKAPVLLQELFTALSTTQPSQEEFELYRTSLNAHYDNATKELPVRQAMQQLDSILFNNPTAQEKIEALRGLSYTEFTQYAQQLFKTAYTEAFFYGNLTPAAAKEQWKTLQASLGAQPFLRNEHPQPQVLVLDQTSTPRKLVQKTDRQGSGALLLLEEGSFTFQSRAIQRILGYALSDAFFDTLRTKQQTGYIAKAWVSEEQRQLLQFFAVQSSTHAPSDLLARFELFLETFDKELSIQVSEEKFESLRSNVITLLSMPPENMSGMGSLLNTLAFEYHDYSWLQKQVASLKALSYDQFCASAHQLLSRSNTRRLAVLMEGPLAKENDFRYEVVTREELVSSGTFSPSASNQR